MKNENVKNKIKFWNKILYDIQKSSQLISQYFSSWKLMIILTLKTDNLRRIVIAIQFQQIATQVENCIAVLLINHKSLSRTLSWFLMLVSLPIVSVSTVL